MSSGAIAACLSTANGWAERRVGRRLRLALFPSRVRSSDLLGAISESYLDFHIRRVDLNYMHRMHENLES